MWRNLLLLFLLVLGSSTPVLCLNQDGLRLLSVKAVLSDPDGNLAAWNSRDATPCSWPAVTCTVNTQQQQVVDSLDFSSFNLAGDLPEILTNLCPIHSLQSLSLYDNSIGSVIPDHVSDCRSLKRLNLSANYLVGEIPGSISDIRNLTSLDLSINNFTGALPASLGAMESLQQLWLFNNLFNETIPSFLFNITSLRELKLAYNIFQPSRLGPELGNLTNLEELWLTDCNLIGEIPDTVGKLTRLWNFDVSVNHLTGPIPSSITEMRSLQQIELYQNSLTGEIPQGMSKLTKLRRIDASGNRLTGSIPDELCRLELDSLILFDNLLTGELPESVATSPYLYELRLFNNSLSGTLPSQLGSNSPLKHLDVSQNQFTGSIPENLCANGELEELLLIDNSFSGTIPESLAQCRSLRRVRLGNNKLTGAVPEGLWGLPHLSLIEFVGNSLTGGISSSIRGGLNISVLRLSDNKFSGSVPEEVGLLRELVELSASGNMLSGGIPGTLVNLDQLGTLDLSSNQLSGGLPAGIESWKKLYELNLANNMLSGEIPGELGSLPVLNYLDLSGNEFSGEIPTELQKLKLNSFNFSNNRLSGDIPPLYAKKSYRESFLGNPGLCKAMAGLCPEKTENKKQILPWMLWLIFIVTGAVLIVGVVAFYFNYTKARKALNMSKWKSFHKYDFSEFEIISCLNEENVIGSGASGKVHKVVLSNGETVAVKKLYRTKSKKDESLSDTENHNFEAEVETLGKIRHKNIVRLWCCYNKGDCKLLVYEYMPKGSLGDLLHSSKGCSLDWPARYKIALDAAEGLSYLHHDCNPPIIHRDVKANNILLDGELGARVSDFGVAKALASGSKAIESMSIIAGSCGYIAPEYAYTLRVNEKSDIYSFGVVLLELVTGKPPLDPEYGEKDLVKWVSAVISNGTDMAYVIDPNLDSSHKEEICRVLNIGLLCTNSLPINRPSMRKVVKMLQEAGGGSRSRSVKKDGKLSPYYYYEDGSESGVAP
uniref:non-specific serine/threonine protein kinase n=1 Tax=Kalanchoe fedtschenkoi TaxID=63787 RepID=A0A7N1A659_KALFE